LYLVKSGKHRYVNLDLSNNDNVHVVIEFLCTISFTLLYFIFIYTIFVSIIK